MDGENLKKILLPTILATIVLLTFAMAFTPLVKADEAVVSIEPSTVDISAVGQTQTVDVNITGVSLMYAYEIKLWYMNNILNTTVSNVVRPTGHFLEPTEDPGNFYQAKWLVNQTQNATNGLVWASVTLLNPESPRNGSGILFRVTFTGVAVGSTPLVLADYPGSQGPVKLSDNGAQPIAHTVSNGTINVIPEIMMLLPIFAVTSLVAVSIAKLRKRKQLR